MSGTLLSFIVAALSVRTLADKLNAFEMMSVRSAGGLIILFAARGRAAWLARRAAARAACALQAARNVVHFVSQICWTIAITVLAVRDRVRARIHRLPPG